VLPGSNELRKTQPVNLPQLGEHMNHHEPTLAQNLEANQLTAKLLNAFNKKFEQFRFVNSVRRGYEMPPTRPKKTPSKNETPGDSGPILGLGKEVELTKYNRGNM
jgi:hypothetical protein